MASTSDLIRSAVGKLAAGAEVDSNSLDSSVTSSESSGVAIDDGGDYVTPDESVEEQLSLGSEESEQEDSQGTEDAEDSPSETTSEKKAETSSSKEVITVSDEKGRRKIEVDFSDKDKLRKYVQMAYGARKWQAERDQAIQSGKQKDEKLSELQSNWNLLNDVYSSKGLEGLVDLLEGRPGAYKQHEKRLVERAKFLENASPEELEAFNTREELERIRRESDRTRKENEEFRSRMEQEREQAELRSVESRVHPVFNKYRFDGKLGDPNDEHMFDEMLWNSALTRLKPYEEQGLDLTPELVEREFKAVATAIRRRIGVQAEKKASRTIQQKKVEATENAQAKVKSGYRSGGSAKEAADLVNSGNIQGLLKGWNKYGSLFNRK